MTELDSALDSAWRVLAQGAADPDSPVHTPSLSNIDTKGRPDSRILVLRAADRASASLRFHTDARSPKVAVLDGAPVHILAWHPAEAIQLRIAGIARIQTSIVQADEIWAAATPFSRRAYLAENAPGTVLPAPASGLPPTLDSRAPTEAELVPARQNFALVLVEITKIDWLHLARSGHRRAVFRRADNWLGEWLVP
ncbi:hypothetical protein GCM10011529_27780 [Polymorphobacter glacialis]|uniref:Pyridoxamine 5'-phosphate oxidase Alr4036 family FMN-binding domain-containing protein n=1 Tax=Sandarakinorhabdus glacialis TaxID=1614636 RepID=A0A917A063_9SPHN|nr:flavin-binding protein [Polymorphobacter glacialis]GGE19629.1 hypothetical protein GCM10011529_27780 [Polymorphobacter glacialis]